MVNERKMVLLQRHARLPLAFVRRRRVMRAAKAALIAESRAGVPMAVSYVNFFLRLGLNPWKLQ